MENPTDEELERRENVENEFKEKMASYVRLYGYNLIEDEKYFLCFENEEKQLVVQVTEFRGRHSWEYRMDFYSEGELVHSENRRKKDIGNAIVDTEGMLIKERIRQKGQQLLDQQSS